MNQHDQMREALQAIETVLSDAYHRHFAECCGRGSEQGCCGDFIEQWTPEDHKILDTLSPIQRHLSQALNHTPDTGKMADHIGDSNKMVRLTDEFLIETYLLCKAEWKATNKRQRERIAVMFGKAVMDAMIANNAPRARITREQVQPIIERMGRITDDGWTFSDLALMALISEIEDLIRNEQ